MFCATGHGCSSQETFQLVAHGHTDGKVVIRPYISAPSNGSGAKVCSSFAMKDRFWRLNRIEVERGYLNGTI